MRTVRAVQPFMLRMPLVAGCVPCKTPTRRDTGEGEGLLADIMSGRFAFVVGAPRCGTTSISAFLQQHPGVCFSLVKEPHFFPRVNFASLSPDDQRKAIETEYLPTYFPDCASQPNRLRAEGSVSYLYFPEQMAAVTHHWPGARFVIALRDPIDQLQSYHQRLLFMGDEIEPDFERAWGLIAERRRGRRIPASCVEPRLLFYDEIGRLGHHVQRFVAAVGKERCFFSVFDDFVADPQAVYRDLLTFLDLPDDARQEFGTHRPTVGYKAAWLQRLLNRPPGVARSAMAETLWLRVRQAQHSASGQRFAKSLWSLRRTLLRWNEAPPVDRRLSPAFEQVIRQTFAQDVDLLGNILGRDLSHWLARTEGRPAT